MVTPPEDPGLETEELLREVLSAPRLPAASRSRHLYAIRLHAATRTSSPVAAGAGTATAAVRIGRIGRLRRRILAASTATALMVVSAGMAAAASTDALPGERLYAVKQIVEQVRLATAGPGEERVTQLLQVADTRLDEAAALARQPARPSDLLEQALRGHEASLHEAAHNAQADDALAAAVTHASGRAAQRLTTLVEDGLADTAAPQARAALQRALERAGGPVPAQDGPAGPPVEPPGQPPGRPVGPPPGRPAGPPGGLPPVEGPPVEPPRATATPAPPGRGGQAPARPTTPAQPAKPAPDNADGGGPTEEPGRGARRGPPPGSGAGR